MLDTDTCAFILRRSSATLLARIVTVPLSQQVISVVTLAELFYGIQLSSKKKANQIALDAMLRHLTIMELGNDAAAHYAEIRAELKRKGQLIGANDLMIAAHARSINAVIVTNNVKDFSRVKGLKVDNWVG